jgi:hypothetical protein
MTAASLSRRGFLTRAAAGVMALLGGSVVGGLSTRAWANPLRHLRSGTRPVIDQPQSIVPIGLDEALRRERRASQLPDVRSLVGELISSGYKRSGEPVGVDGVGGWPTEGGRAVSLGFAKNGSEEATVFVVARWWDEKRRDAWPREDVMPDVFSRELIRGAPGTSSVVRFRYVDERGGLVSRDFEANSAADVYCPPNCHPHPPGTCPSACTAACVHCSYYANVCTGSPPDCSACKPCLLCWPWWCGASCALICEAVCSTLTETYCCDYSESVCCPPDYSYFPPRVECL